ncbi:MAG: hypothetical protein L0Z70_01460 [Chloroflexi bacterium]|nr:hypothetical protein [Chloroflexota bacterium]
MKTTRLTLIVALLLAALLIAACNMPADRTPTPESGGALYTAAAQTVEAQLTQMAQPAAATQTPAPQQATQQPAAPTPTLVPVQPTATQAAVQPSPTLAPTATPIPCDRAEFVKDVTVPDGTEMDAGETFVKTWRLRNNGSCTWNSSYALVYSGGANLNAPASVPLPGSVAPGQTVDVSVNLRAPDDGGDFRSDFKLRNASNVVFGLGNQNKPFFVMISVAVNTGLVYDFPLQADKAGWASGVGDVWADLAYNGADDNASGAAKIKDGVKLENGATSGKVIFMYPKHDANGWTFGRFPAYKVQSGDHFKARLGFYLPSGDTCHTGKVKFQLYYREGSSEFQLLKEWVKSCDGSLLPVDVDLSTLKGRTVDFALAVMAEGNFTDDWAVWNSPRIDH